MFDYGERKIIGVNYTRYISLPKSWLNAMGVDVHSKIHVSMNDKQELILTPATASLQAITETGAVVQPKEAIHHE